MNRKTFLAVGAGAAVCACSARVNSAGQYEILSGNGAPLRSAFNRDVDKVRILMLVSPT